MSGKRRKRQRRNTIHPQLKKDVLLRDGYKCLCCKSTTELTIDHILPQSMGGLNSIDNLQTLCRICNEKKGVRHIDYRKVSTNDGGNRR